MQDRISIQDLEVFYRVGVPEAERAVPQRLLITLDMEREFRDAASRDELKATIDYSVVSRRLLGFGEGKEWRLIETLAVDLAEMVLRDFGPASVIVEVKKFVVPEARYVSVRVKRPISDHPTTL